MLVGSLWRGGLVVRRGCSRGTSRTGITGPTKSGRNGGDWSGSGIITSQSQAIGSNYTSIGVAKASDARPATATALRAGQTITSTDTLVMDTYGGDANLDAKINVDDYIKIDSGIAAGLTGWSNGDFNYYVKVNIHSRGPTMWERELRCS